MPRTPDPSYWGNPPQTPVSKYAPQRTGHQANSNQPPVPPAPASSYGAEQPAGSSQQQPQAASQPQQTPGQADPGTQHNAAQGESSQQQGAAASGFNYAQPNTPPTPPSPPKKSNRGIIIAIVAAIVVLLLGMAGCSACTVAISSGAGNYLGSTYSNPQNIPSFDNDQYSSSPDTESDQAYLNAQTRNAFDLQGSSALSEEELSQLQADFFGGSSNAPNAEGIYPQGIFHVGTDLPAGSYWFSGSSSDLSYFFILQPTSDGASTYNAVHVNTYYGHNLMNLEDGEVLILVNNGTMTPIAKMTQQFTSPYGSGVYRVGIDIPAGSYRAIVGDGADTYSAYYVMSDLDYRDDSFIESNYFVSGDSGTEIILEEGTYVELYNMRLVAILS